VRWLSLLALCLLPLLGWAESRYTLVPLERQVAVTVDLADDDDDFWTSVREHVRAGYPVTIRFEMTLDAVGVNLWNVGEATQEKYVRYDVLKDDYVLKSPDGSSLTTSDEADVKAFVRQATAVPIAEKSDLRTGDEYYLGVSARILTPDDEGWAAYNPFRGIFRPVLEAGFYVVAR
jgi:hypothetical protein